MDLTSLIRTRKTDRIAPKNAKNLLFATPELSPFSMRSQLGEAVGGLTRKLIHRGHRVSVLMPFYNELNLVGINPSRRATELEVPRQGKNRKKVTAALYEADFRGLRLLLIDQESYFDVTGPSAFDDPVSVYSFLSRAAVEFLRQTSNDVEYLVCEGWQTSLAPVYGAHYYEDELAEITTVFRQHDSLEVGTYGKEALEETGLPKSYYNKNQLRTGDDISFAQGGIRYADRILFNSESYLDSVLTGDVSSDFTYVVTENRDKIDVVPDFIDGKIWAPQTDPYIEHNYSVRQPSRKRLNKPAIQDAAEIGTYPESCLFTFDAASADRTSAEIVRDVFEDLLSTDPEEIEFQLLWLDSDTGTLENIEDLVDQFPDRVGLLEAPSEKQLHRVYAGSDVIVRPDPTYLFDLSHLVAMEYGTLIVGHATGLLTDTIEDLGTFLEAGTYQIPEFEESSLEGRSVGFLFEPLSKESFEGSIERVTSIYRDYNNWLPIVEKVMGLDFTWERAIVPFEKVLETEPQLDEAS